MTWLEHACVDGLVYVPGHPGNEIGSPVSVFMEANPVAKFRVAIDFLVMETFQRLFGVLSLCNLLDKTIPEAELEETASLREVAKGEGWDYGEYQAEVQGIEAKFRRWLPRFSAYSIIILLHSILETQLAAYAERVGRTKKAARRLKDTKGKGIEQARRFLKQVSTVDIGSDPSWKRLGDLRALRNIIVHGGGKLAESKKRQQVMDRLLRSYEGKLAFREADKLYGFGEIWVSMPLCRMFAHEVEEFFERLFKAAGLPDRRGTQPIDE